MLTRSEDGTFVLEDLDDQVKLDISEASPASGMFTEGCFALLDGQYTKDSIFKVLEIGHPPSETREATRSALTSLPASRRALTYFDTEPSSVTWISWARALSL